MSYFVYGVAAWIVLLGQPPGWHSFPIAGASEPAGSPHTMGRPDSGAGTIQSGSHPDLTWYDDYGAACAAARARRCLLLINFVPEAANPWADALAHQAELDKGLATHAAWRRQLQGYVLARLPQDAEILSAGKSLRLLEHGAFAEMHGRPGIAMIDFTDPEAAYFGHVVSAYPFMTAKYYRWQVDYFPTILDLPPGTITQRTMVWAVRVHPERPASTEGIMDNRLARAARRHSEYQARIGRQGHHRWEGRFHRLRALLGGGTPVEIVAESWPGQSMIDSCLDCVASWRYSSGHWNAVRNRHAVYGYDIHKGNNGIWYGTGIFASFH